VRITIAIAPTTKKTSNRTWDIGRRCPRCTRGERTLVMPSKNYEDFEAAVAPALQAAMAKRSPDRETCPRCNDGKRGGRRCLSCGGTMQRAVPFRVPVLVEAIFYRERDVGDLAGYIQALGDVLEVAGVVSNDRLIAGWPIPRDGRLPLRKDAERPRIELFITPVPEVQPDLFEASHVH
jgi:hypothetical protein